ncbi:MAG: enoyl-CoA hydratase-related protein [Pseudomonadota bacterium]
MAGLQAAASDDAVRAVVLTGAGGRVFSGGIDLKEAGDLDPVARRAIAPTGCCAASTP